MKRLMEVPGALQSFLAAHPLTSKQRGQFGVAIGVMLLLILLVVGAHSFVVPQAPTDPAQSLVAAATHEQRSDGFFVFSTNETNPPVIAESYFAVIVFRYYHVAIPHATTLERSLVAMAQTANSLAGKGNFTLNYRDIYEMVELRQMVGDPMHPSELANFLPYLAARSQHAPNLAVADMHDWYYANLVLLVFDDFTSLDRATLNAIVSQVAGAVGIVDVLTLSMVIDLATLAAAQAQLPTGLSVKLMSAQSRGGFTYAHGVEPDILTSFFCEVAVSDLGHSHAGDAGNADALLSWVQSLETSSGYALAKGQAVTPLGTAYALLLINVVHKQTSTLALR